MQARTLLVGGAAVLALSLSGCLARHIHQWGEVDQGVATLHPVGESGVTGMVRFYQLQEGVRVVAELEGLEPDSRHGFHIHEYGDCTAVDAKSAGGHYNPTEMPHGLPPSDARHAGDLGNLEADDEGKASYDITVDNITVAELTNPIVGRAVIVHAKEDTGEQPTGAAGARIACGVIGVANPGSGMD